MTKSKQNQPKLGRPPVFTSKEALATPKVIRQIGETNQKLARARIDRAVLKHAAMKQIVDERVKTSLIES